MKPPPRRPTSRVLTELVPAILGLVFLSYWHPSLAVGLFCMLAAAVVIVLLVLTARDRKPPSEPPDNQDQP